MPDTEYILYENNYYLSILPNIDLFLIEINISGNINIVNNIITINFDNIDNLYSQSYYLINNNFFFSIKYISVLPKFKDFYILTIAFL